MTDTIHGNATVSIAEAFRYQYNIETVGSNGNGNLKGKLLFPPTSSLVFGCDDGWTIYKKDGCNEHYRWFKAPDCRYPDW
jgi:hypothetical protein